MPESFNTNISHQLCNLQHENTNSKRDFVLKNKPVLNVCFKDFWHTETNLAQIWYGKLNK